MATFWIKVPLFVARQHMRHRTFSFNEISRRYTSNKIEFYLPENVRMQDTKNRQASLDETFNPVIEFEKYETNPFPFQKINSTALRLHTEQSLTLYDKLIGQGVAREQARMVLPQNLYTTYWCTSSMHNWVNSFIAKEIILTLN